MSWSITLSGTKEDALKEADRQLRGLVAMGMMTEDEAAAVISMARNVRGTHLSGSVSGHNEEASGYVSASITGRVQSGS